MKTLAFALLLPFAAFAENEIGFIERFALAADREKALGELVPGSEAVSGRGSNCSRRK